jgi:hypothetical protein
MPKTTNLWRGWVLSYLRRNDLAQFELASIFQCDGGSVSQWLNHGQTPTRKMMERARDTLSFDEWLGAMIAAGYVPPTLGAESCELILEMAKMPPSVQAKFVASFRTARCA